MNRPDPMDRAKARQEDRYEELKAQYERLTGGELPELVTLPQLEALVAEAYENHLAPANTPEEQAVIDRIRREDQEDAIWAARELGR